MGAVAPIAMGISAAFQTVGALRQASAESDAAQFNAKQAEENASLVLQESAENERIFRIQANKILGEQKAAMAASGMQTDLGVLAETVSNIEGDALRMSRAGVMKAQGLYKEAGMYRERAKSARENGALSAVGYLLGGAGKVASMVDTGSSSTKSGYLKPKFIKGTSDA